VETLILSARSLETLQAVADECRAVDKKLKIHCLVCDLSDPAAVDRLAAQALDKCNPVDVLINNGGVSSRSRFVDTNLSIDRQVMQINFWSGAALAKAIVPGMLTSKAGRIIWISSVQGLVGIPSRTSYAASKFAVQGYCESLRAEVASSGVSVHCVSPGYIRTNLSKSALQGDGSKYGIMDTTTAAGADPIEVAVTILDKAAAGNGDFCVAAPPSALAAIWMRLLCPGLLQSLLVKRYEKSQTKEKSE
jgi:dehydrogenase/reductase SDR family protein 7B